MYTIILNTTMNKSLFESLYLTIGSHHLLHMVRCHLMTCLGLIFHPLLVHGQIIDFDSNKSKLSTMSFQMHLKKLCFPRIICLQFT